MGRSPCCEKVGLKKGPWTPEEDQKLLAYIEEHGHGSWRALPATAGLQRCGKSCRLRWTNYLRPDIKRGKFSLQEEQTIIQLHALLGNRWSAIATHLPKRTDNEIKNYWNTHLKKRLTKMGIDPVTHKPRGDALGPGNCRSKSVTNLSHMAQWESARLEAEARLVRETKLRAPTGSEPFQQAQSHLLCPPPLPLPLLHNESTTPPPPCLDVLQACRGAWPKLTSVGLAGGIDLESPTSTLNFSENAAPIASVGKPMRALDAKDHGMDDLPGFTVDTMLFGGEATWLPEASSIRSGSSDGQNSMERVGDSDNADDGDSREEGNDDDDEEEEENDYWNSLLDLVNSSAPSNWPPPGI